MRLLAALHDPFMALCFAQALPGRLAGIVTFGGPREASLFPALGLPFVLAPPPRDASTTALLADPGVAAFVAATPSLLLVFKSSRRLEERALALGATLALPPASLSQGLENKLALAGLARDAGIGGGEDDDRVALPRQRRVDVTPDLSWETLQALVGAEADGVVVQSPRGYMGRRTWAVHDAPGWGEVRAELTGRPAKVTRFVRGRPGTVNAVVDSDGAVLVSAPIVQITGEPTLTPFPLGSCGNDFTWRPTPHPGDGPYELARRLGPVLARRGYRGHFGLDVVVEDRPDGAARTWLIEINPRITASMALCSAFAPALAEAHLAAVLGSALPRTGVLNSIEGGQLLVHQLGPSTGAPLQSVEAGVLAGSQVLPESGAALWSSVTTEVEPGATRGRIVVRGPVIDAAGRLPAFWPPPAR